MDNNKEGQNPVFTSTNINATKSRADNAYFTNIQKASFGQKLSEKFAKYQINSETKQKNKSAASKEKRSAKRRAADLKAMSVNIPIAAENGNPALMNTHYAPRPRAKTSPVVAAALIFLILALIAGIVVAIMKPWEPADLADDPTQISSEYTLPEGATHPTMDFNYGGFDLNTFDVTEAYPNEGPLFVYGLLASAGLDMVVMKDGEVDVDTSIKQLDYVIQHAGVNGYDNLLLFQFAKARLYATTGHPHEARVLLEGVTDEDALYEAQQFIYFDAYRHYYLAIGDNDKANEYSAKFDGLFAGPGIGGVEEG